MINETFYGKAVRQFLGMQNNPKKIQSSEETIKGQFRLRGRTVTHGQNVDGNKLIRYERT